MVLLSSWWARFAPEGAALLARVSARAPETAGSFFRASQSVTVK
jgi:hypothetical protein